MQCSAVRCGAVRCGAVRCGAVRCGAVRCGAVRCGAVCCRRGPQQEVQALGSLRAQPRTICGPDSIGLLSSLQCRPLWTVPAGMTPPPPPPPKTYTTPARSERLRNQPGHGGDSQVVSAYTLESGSLGVTSTARRTVGRTMLARAQHAQAHAKHQGLELVARVTGGRHCRPPLDPLLPRSRRPKVLRARVAS